jgi:O-antigen/teichoic acid export membrane protein
MSEIGIRSLIIRGTVATLAVRGLAMVLALLMNVVVARSLSLGDFGVFAVCTSWLTVGGTIACWGMNTVATRLVAEGSARDPVASPAVVSWGRRVTLAGGALAAVASLGAAQVLFREWDGNQRLGLTIAMLGLPVFAHGIYLSGVLTGAKRPAAAVAVETALRPAVLLLIVAGVSWLAGEALTLLAVVGALVTAQAVAVAAGELWTPRRLRAAGGSIGWWNREWLSIAAPIGAINAMAVLMANLDTLALGHWRGADAAGLYRPAVQLATLVPFGLVASNAIVAPIIAELYSTGQIQQLQRALRFSTGLVAGVGTVATLVLAVGGRTLLGLFGPQFVAAYPALMILLGGQMINTWSGPTGLLMSMSGRQRQAVVIFGVSSLIAVVANVTLVPRFGLLGAAAANAAGLASWNLAVLVYARRRIGVDPSLLGWFDRSRGPRALGG